MWATLGDAHGGIQHYLPKFVKSHFLGVIPSYFTIHVEFTAESNETNLIDNISIVLALIK